MNDLCRLADCPHYVAAIGATVAASRRAQARVLRKAADSADEMDIVWGWQLRARADQLDGAA